MLQGGRRGLWVSILSFVVAELILWPLQHFGQLPSNFYCRSAAYAVRPCNPAPLCCNIMLSTFCLQVRKRHAFLSKAFTRPVEEPAVPLTHWSYLLTEMEWLAADVAQVSSTHERMGWQVAASPQDSALTCL